MKTIDLYDLRKLLSMGNVRIEIRQDPGHDQLLHSTRIKLFVDGVDDYVFDSFPRSENDTVGAVVEQLLRCAHKKFAERKDCTT